MAFNGSGTFTRLYSWVQQKSLAFDIDSTKMDLEDNGYATGLSNCICRDGQSIISADIPWNNKKITSLGDPVSNQDAATLHWVTTANRVFPVATPSAPSTAGGAGTFGLQTSGTIGGGVALTDGTHDIALWSVSGKLAIGFGTSHGALTQKFSVDAGGNLVAVGSLTASAVVTSGGISATGAIASSSTVSGSTIYGSAAGLTGTFPGTVNATGIINNGTALINISGNAGSASSVGFNGGLTTGAAVTFGGVTVNGTVTSNCGAGYGHVINFGSAGGGVGILSAPNSSPATHAQWLNGSASIVGSISTTVGATLYNTSSDADLKTIHGDHAAEESLATVNKIKLYKAAFLVEPDQIRPMLLAHELQAVIPHAVTGDYRACVPARPVEGHVVEEHDGPVVMEQVFQGVDYSKIMVDAIGAIQALTAKVAYLEKKLGISA